MPSSFEIAVGARNSPLSRKQVEEVYEELKKVHPHVVFKPIFVETVGDRDKITSLRSLDKTDFFTRDIDQMLLKGECRIAIHSAKDLPDPLPEGIVLAALTKGVDPSDSLVFPEGQTTLPEKGIVATSSVRREECVRKLFPSARFVDIRGTIGERLAQLESRKIDGVVIAEAALIRLGLTHLNRITLPGETAPLQGKLAITACAHDREILEIIARCYCYCC